MSAKGVVVVVVCRWWVRVRVEVWTTKGKQQAEMERSADKTKTNIEN